MGDALEEVSWLVRSLYRAELLRTLETEACGRAELRESTGMSRVTLKRTLEELVQRDWVRERGGVYETTGLGELVCDRLSELVRTVEMSERVGPFVEALPVEAFDFGLELFAAATVTTADETDRLAPFRRADTLLSGADRRVELLAAGVNALHVETVSEQPPPETATVVYERDTVATIADDPELRRRTGEALRRGYELYAYDGEVPVTVELVDDMLGFRLAGVDGVPSAFLELSAPAAVAWAERTVETYREQAERIDHEAWQRRD